MALDTGAGRREQRHQGAEAAEGPLPHLRCARLAVVGVARDRQWQQGA